MSTQFYCCMDNPGWSNRQFLHFLSIFSPCTNWFYFVSERNGNLTPSAVWKLLTNHHWVVAWWLLDAVCPVLLTRDGIPWKGLTAQWLSNSSSVVQRQAPPFCKVTPPLDRSQIVLWSGCQTLTIGSNMYSTLGGEWCTWISWNCAICLTLQTTGMKCLVRSCMPEDNTTLTITPARNHSGHHSAWYHRHRWCLWGRGSCYSSKTIFWRILSSSHSNGKAVNCRTSWPQRSSSATKGVGAKSTPHWLWNHQSHCSQHCDQCPSKPPPWRSSCSRSIWLPCESLYPRWFLHWRGQGNTSRYIFYWHYHTVEFLDSTYFHLFIPC